MNEATTSRNWLRQGIADFSTKVRFRIDEITVESNSPFKGCTKVNFTILTGFDHENRCMPQLRVAIGDIEKSRVVYNKFEDQTHRRGSYFLNTQSKFTCGDELEATLRTQVAPATTREAVIGTLVQAPELLAISFYPGCAWIHWRDAGPGNDEAMEFVPNPSLIVEMLRDGLLELNCCDEVVLTGYAKYPASKRETRAAAIDWMIGPEAEKIWPKLYVPSFGGVRIPLDILRMLSTQHR